MKFGSLFSGIGGFDLGFEQSDMVGAWQVEIDANCQKLLGVKFPNAKRSSDVRHANRTNLETVDVICGGFPCQDLSVAGKRKGLAGERSGLWFAFHRIVAELKPRWVVIENVPGLLSSNNGRDFAIILRGLVECGYGVCWRVLDARYFGVAQRRRRVCIVASLGNGCCAQVLFESESVQRDITESHEAGPGIAGTLKGGTGKRGYPDPSDGNGGRLTIAGTLGARTRAGGFPGTDEALDGYIQVAGTLAANRGGLDRPAGNANELDFCIPTLTSNGDAHSGFKDENGLIAFDYCMQGSERTQICRTGGEYAQLQANRPDAIAILGDGRPGRSTLPQGRTTEVYSNVYGVRRLTPVECERLQGFPDGWTEGFADSVRYRMLGNAVCVPVARWIGKRIKEIDND